MLIALAVASAVTVTACDDLKNNLLEATDPDIIDPSAVQSAAGATAVRNGALSRLRTATADGEAAGAAEAAAGAGGAPPASLRGRRFAAAVRGP